MTKMTDAFKKLFLDLGGNPKELAENNDVGDYIVDLESAIKEYVGDKTDEVVDMDTNTRGLIANAYDPSRNVSYAVGDYCIYNDAIYKCVAATTGLVWDSSKWELFTGYVTLDQWGGLLDPGQWAVAPFSENQSYIFYNGGSSQAWVAPSTSNPCYVATAEDFIMYVYFPGEVCTYVDKIYRCIENTGGEWDPSKWEALGNLMGMVDRIDETIISKPAIYYVDYRGHSPQLNITSYLPDDDSTKKIQGWLMPGASQGNTINGEQIDIGTFLNRLGNDAAAGNNVYESRINAEVYYRTPVINNNTSTTDTLMLRLSNIVYKDGAIDTVIFKGTYEQFDSEDVLHSYNVIGVSPKGTNASHPFSDIDFYITKMI